jgi:predicted molibdopterin-dependent oxidoreductase YjgC
MVLEDGKFKQTSWEAALDLAASRLKELSQGGMAVLTDGSATNEELYLLQKFSRNGLKAGLMGCMTPPGHQEASATLNKSLGLSGATGSLNDLKNAGCILALGIHTAGDNPIAGTRIRQAVLNGTKLVSASPVQTAVSRYADIHLDIYPGTESALIAGLLRLCLMNPSSIEPGFSEQYGADLEALKASLEPYSLEEVSRITGTSQEKLIEASCLLTGSRPLHLVYGRAVLNHSPASSVIKGLLTLSRALGSLHQPGGGITPLYGSGNLQGAMDMGMAPYLLPEGIERGGLASKQVAEVLGNGNIKGLFFVAESHDSSAWAVLKPHLAKLDLVLIHDIALPKSAEIDLPEGTIFLPMASVLEKEGTLTNGEHRIQKVQPVVSSPGESRCSRWVVSELARRLGFGDFEFKSADSIFQVIRDEIPAYAGTEPSGLIIANSRQNNGGDHGTSWIPSPSGFQVELKDKEHPFALIAKERLIPYFTGPLSAEEALIASSSGDAIAMNPADAFGMGFLPGDAIRIVTRHGALEGPLAMWELIPEGAVSIPLHMLNSLAEQPGMNQTIFAASVEKG